MMVNAVKREINRGKKNKIQTKDVSLIPPIPLNKKYKNWKSFGFKEASNKKLVIALYIVPTLVAMLLSIINTWVLVIASVLTPFIRMLLVYLLTNKEYRARLDMLQNLLIFKKAKMGLVDNNSNVYTASQEMIINKWEDGNPKEIVFTVPITFAADNRLEFVRALSEKFNFDGYWREGKDGWDDKNNTVTMEWKEFLDQQQQDFVGAFLEFKKKAMGLANPRSSLYTYYYEIDNIQWDEENKPTDFEIYLPVGYDSLQYNTFLDKLSQQFGRGRPFETNNEIAGRIGYDSENRIAIITLQQPLPDLAMFDERYVLNDTVQWSYFPLGIGSRGGIPFKDPNTGEEIRLCGFDVNGAQQKFLKKKGIFVGGDLMPSPHAIMAGVTGGGKSVCQRSVIFECLLRPKDWFLIIIDMKKVEGAMYRKYGVPVATTYEDAAMLLSYAQKVMMDRYETMEKLGINNWSDMPEDQRGQALMINVDEAGELLAPIKGKDDESKQNAEYQAQCQNAMESIARLGRAARVHMLVASQRPDSETISMQIRQNCPTRIGAGALPETISGMVFESNFGATIPSKPQGRVGLKIHSSQPSKIQGFFPKEDFLDEYLAKHNLPTNIQGSNEMTAIYEKNKKEAEAESKLVDSLDDEDFQELSDILGEI